MNKKRGKAFIGNTVKPYDNLPPGINGERERRVENEVDNDYCDCSA